MLISVESKFATYHHVVGVWREMVIDYESMYMYPLTEDKFPMLISVESKFATYHHVVGVWRDMVIYYESIYMYPLTEDTLRQICGVNTTFQRISCGDGILPSTICKTFEGHQYIQDWGIADL